MEGSSIFHRRDGELISLIETPFATEDLLQSLLAEHPGLLAGDELGDAPRRWVLLSREAGIADREGAGARWSLDHLFVDQDAIPTLVEVKRSSDTRIRREVIGQLLEYAANGVRYWPIEQLRALFELGCENRGTHPEDELSDLLGETADTDEWWANVEANLRSGRLRLVFVADAISRELRRIIEFLNEQMTRTEVIGVEIRQYVDASGSHQTLVPRLIGQTEAARDAKSIGGSRLPPRKWNRERWLEVFGEAQPEQKEIVHRLLGWADERGLTFLYGSGAQNASIQFGYVNGGHRVFPFFVYARGGFEVQFKLLKTLYRPFESQALREELRDRLAQIPGVSISDDKLDKRPNLSLSLLRSEAAFAHFTATMEWVFAQVDQLTTREVQR